MKPLLLICIGMLLLALTNLPIGNYTLLRIIVTIGAMAIFITDFEDGLNLGVVSFIIIAAMFNPIFPIYFGSKGIWMTIDLLTAILFAIKLLTLKGTKI